jgi:hypothetical protein
MIEPLFTLILCFGVVDRVDEGVVVAEVVDRVDNIHYVEFVLKDFPCEIKEQEKFYLTYDNGVLDIHCQHKRP